ncbi:MAG: outer membrane protein transport protein [Patescibacteria group bacterium]
MVIILTLAAANVVDAAGVNRLGGVGPRAAGMSGAYMAISDDASAFYYNPAGLSRTKGGYAFVGVESITPEFSYQLPSILGGFSENSKNGVIYSFPLIGVSHSVGDYFSIGLGINSPYGLGAKFKGDASHGFPQTENFIGLTDFTPAVSFRPADNFFFGLSANIGYGSLKSKAPFSVGGQVSGISDSRANGWGIGGTLGFIWQASEKVDIGFSYRTKTKVSLEGDTKFTTVIPGLTEDNFQSSFVFPARLTSGVAIWPAEKWLLAFDANWYDYSGVRSLDIDYKKLPDEKQMLDWKNNYSLHFGAEYHLFEKIFLRAGTGYQSSAAPDETVSSLTPDVSGWDMTFGLGYQWDNFSFDGSYIYAWGNREVGLAADRVAPGEYEAKIGSFALGLSYNF